MTIHQLRAAVWRTGIPGRIISSDPASEASERHDSGHISKIINAGPTQAEWIRAGRLLPNSGPSTGPGQPTVNSMELGRGTSSR